MKRTVIFLIVLIAALAVDPAYILASNLTFHEPEAISFEASLNASSVAQGHAVEVVLRDQNALGFRDSVPLSEGPNALNLSTGGQCGNGYPDYPGGVVVYNGAYSLSNLTSATPLPFYPPGPTICFVSDSQSFYPNPASFTFQPHQIVTASIDLPGYYTTGSSYTAEGGYVAGVLHPYVPGVYTVIAGNPLGDVKVMYFHVTGTTGKQEQSGPLSTFPASWSSWCGQSSTGNVTTGVYLNLNGSSAFDHINIYSVYAQIVNSSEFAYISVGHGWVVSEWAGIEGSGDPSDGKIFAVFILTTGGVPTGYAYGYYYPDGGPMTVQASGIAPPGC